MTVWTIPRNPPGEGEPKSKLKIDLSTARKSLRGNVQKHRGIPRFARPGIPQDVPGYIRDYPQRLTYQGPSKVQTSAYLRNDVPGPYPFWLKPFWLKAQALEKTTRLSLSLEKTTSPTRNCGRQDRFGWRFRFRSAVGTLLHTPGP